MATIAGVIAILTGFGFGLPGIFGLRHFARHRAIFTFMGFPTYGGGPFERLGLPTSTPLLAGFVAVCAAEIVIGHFLLSGAEAALWASIVLLPFELIYWFGFALPYGFLLGAVRLAAVLAALS